MKTFVTTVIVSGVTCFMGFIWGIAYTVQAANTSLLVKVIAILKGVIGA